MLWFNFALGTVRYLPLFWCIVIYIIIIIKKQRKRPDCAEGKSEPQQSQHRHQMYYNKSPRAFRSKMEETLIQEWSPFQIPYIRALVKKFPTRPRKSAFSFQVRTFSAKLVPSFYIHSLFFCRCWLSISSGLIWTFIGPSLTIVLVGFSMSVFYTPSTYCKANITEYKNLCLSKLCRVWPKPEMFVWSTVTTSSPLLPPPLGIV